MGTFKASWLLLLSMYLSYTILGVQVIQRGIKPLSTYSRNSEGTWGNARFYLTIWCTDLHFHLSTKKKCKNDDFNSPHVYQRQCILRQGLGGAGAEYFAPCLFLILPWQICWYKHWRPAHTANSNRSLRIAQERIRWTRVSDNHSILKKRFSPLSHCTLHEE